MRGMVPYRFRNSLDKVRKDLMDVFERNGGEEQSWFAPFFGGFEGPAIDIEETDGEIDITAELPGLEEKDFKVEVSGENLVIRGEKRSSKEEKKKDYYYSERSYGTFCRTVPLPAEVDQEKAEAKYKDGILKIRLPKSEQARKKQIKVEVT